MLIPATTDRRKLPILLRLFCAYLITMLPVVATIESIYVLLSDDWTFGFKSSRVSNALGYLLFFILVGQHMYRMFTVSVMMLKARFSVANAKVYLIASAAMITAFGVSTVVSFPQSTGQMQFHLEGMRLPIVVLSFALMILLAWWILLSASKEVRAFENAQRI